MTELRRRPLAAALIALGVAVAGCGTTAPTTSPSPSPATSVAGSQRPSAAPSGSGATIPQPDVRDLQVADDAARVDIAMPTFSNPTAVTNPLFPIAHDTSNLLVGEVDGLPFRTEVTVLPTTRVVEWNGQSVETLVSQYVAFSDGRIHEVAYDLYAQADDGSVWYFGEDVFNFADGSIADTHGTWLAGRDGPAAMIMPGDPAVGDVYRPENIPGLVFEEVTVQGTGETVDGPFGPVEGAIVVEELHMDGTTEEKTFAPGYGEFYTASGPDVEALAMAVPEDAGSGSVPPPVVELEAAALAAFDAFRNGNSAQAADESARVEAARAALPDGEVPALLIPLLDGWTATLASAADAGDSEAGMQAAIELGRLAADLRLRHDPIVDVDMSRIGLWGAQLVLDAMAEDAAAVHADVFAFGYTRERVIGGVPGETADALNAILEELQGASADEDFAALIDAGDAIRELAGGA